LKVFFSNKSKNILKTHESMINALNYLSLLGELSAFMVSFSVIIYKMMLKYSKLSNDLGITPNHFIRNVDIT